jgi:hypothetical protein
MKKAFFALILLCFGLTGCETHTVTRKELVEVMSQHSNETIYEVRYMGSRSIWNYIAIQHTIGSDYYRIENTEFPISLRFPLTKNEKDWRVLNSSGPFGSVIDPPDSILYEMKTTEPNQGA